jgi:hypothetical protein
MSEPSKSWLSDVVLVLYSHMRSYGLSYETRLESELAKIAEQAYAQGVQAGEARGYAEAIGDAAIRGRIAQLEEKVVDVEIRNLLTERPRGDAQGSNPPPSEL